MYSSEGTIMDIGDTLQYVFYFKDQHPDWDFDDLTGGASEFVDSMTYKKVKKEYEVIMKIRAKKH